MPDKQTVNIRIKRDTWRQLHNRKNPNDSFDDVIQRLLAADDARSGETPGNVSDVAGVEA